MNEQLLTADTFDLDADLGFLTEQMLDLSEDDLFDLNIPDLEALAAEDVDHDEEDDEDEDDDALNYDLEFEANIFFTDEHQFSTSFGSSFKDLLASSPGFRLKDASPSRMSLGRSPSKSSTSFIKTGSSPAVGTVSSHSFLETCTLNNGHISSLPSSGNGCKSLDTNNNLASRPLNTITMEDMATLNSALANVGFDLFKEMSELQSSRPTNNTISSRASCLSSHAEPKRGMKKSRRSKGVSLLAKPPTTGSTKLSKSNASLLKHRSTGNSFKMRRWLAYSDHDYCSGISLLA